MSSANRSILDAKTQNLRQLFSGYGDKFQIPENQREYVWTEHQFETLLSDLNYNFKKGVPSFLGTVCLSEAPDQGYHIVDGQQRITTFCILLHVLQENLSVNCQVIPAFAQKLTTLKNLSYENVAQLVALFDCCSMDFLNYLLNQVCFSVLIIPDAMRYKIFDSVNSTGKPLEIQELVYNMLYERTANGSKDKLAEAWSAFLALMQGTEDAGAAQEVATVESHAQSDGSDDNALKNNGKTKGSAKANGPAEDGADADESESEQAKTGITKKQLNFRHFFTAFVRIDCTQTYSRDLYRALECRLDRLAAENGTPAKDGSELAQDILEAARYYALFVAPLDQLNADWFKKRFPGTNESGSPAVFDAFVRALVRFSTLHLGDALPLLMRLAQNGYRIDNLTVYLDGIFQVCLLAQVTQNRKLRQAVLRRLPGLDQEIEALLKSNEKKILSLKKDENKTSYQKKFNIVQIALIGNLEQQYQESRNNLESYLELLRYQGNASVITSLLVAQALAKNPTLGTLQAIHENGGFSLEHIIPQSDSTTSFVVHQPGNLVLLEKNLNSKASNKPIAQKIITYRDSVFDKEILSVVDSLYGNSVDPENTPQSELLAKIEGRTEALSKDLARLFQEEIPFIKAPKKAKLAFLEETPEGTRTWTWKWITDSNKNDAAKKGQPLPIYYYDDGSNSRTTKDMQNVVRVQTLDKNGKPFTLLERDPNRVRIELTTCTKHLIYILFNMVKDTVTPQRFRDALERCADPRNGLYSRYISTQPVTRNNNEKTTSQGITFTFGDASPLTLHLASDQNEYATHISEFFNTLITQLGIAQSSIPPVFLEYEKARFREENRSYFSRYAYIFGNESNYLKVLQAENAERQSQIRKIPAQTAPPSFAQGFAPEKFISSEIITLEGLAQKIGNSTINVPMYQRKYVWTQENWNRLKEDCMSTQSEDLFLGILLLGDRGDGTYDLIDGQQRLTTLSYLFPNLKLKKHIQFSDKALSESFHKGEGIYEGLAAYAAKAQIPQWAAQKIRFLVLTLQKDSANRAGELFATVNGRGLRLTPGEIIKNFILMNADAFRGPEQPAEEYHKIVTPMWKDRDAFEQFIKAYLDMWQQALISKREMVTTVKQIAQEGEEVASIQLQDAKRGSGESIFLNPDCVRFWKFLQDSNQGNLVDDEDIAIYDYLQDSLKDVLQSSFLDQVIFSNNLDFFREMPKYWSYYTAITQATQKGQKKGDTVPEIALDNTVKGELYLHRLVGTHTTLPPLLYFFARWQEAPDVDEKHAARESFLNVLRSLTDAFLACHLLGYETALKSMDKRMAALCSGLTIPDFLTFEEITGRDIGPACEKFTRLERGLGQDLYHKRQTLALLMLWRCEQTLWEDEDAFYELVCKACDGTLKPSVEHITPQADNTLAVNYAWNYILLEGGKNSSASNNAFHEKQKVYASSAFKMAKMLSDPKICSKCPDQTTLMDQKAAQLLGPKGPNYLRSDAEKAEAEANAGTANDTADVH